MANSKIEKFVYNDPEKALDMANKLKYTYLKEGLYLDHTIHSTVSDKYVVHIEIKIL